MKKSILLLLILSIITVVTVSLSGCGGNSNGLPTPTATSTPTVTPTLTTTPTATLTGFTDNFDGFTVANPWAPADGWTSTVSDVWAIVNPGYSNNGLKFIGTSSTFLTSSFTGTDYTVSCKVRPVTINSNWEFGICARYFNNYNGYAVVLNDNQTTPITRIRIIKYYNNGTNYCVSQQTFLNANLNTSTYYTLSLQVSGSGPVQVDATVTGGGSSQSVSFTDDGTVYGGELTSGKAGIYVYPGGAYTLIYDNFTVTVP